MAKKKSETKTAIAAFNDCFETVNTSGVVPRQWPILGVGKKWNELTRKEQAAFKKHPHRWCEYDAFQKLCSVGIIEPLFVALEDVYADFPKSEQQYSEKNAIPNERNEYEGIKTPRGEKQYLNSVVSGLLSLMNEAIERGNSRDATRFAFEAGILWSMCGQTHERRIASAVKHGLAKGRADRTAEADELGISIRAELQSIMRDNPAKNITWARKQLEERGTHGVRRTIVTHSKTDTFPEGANQPALHRKKKNL